MEHPKLSLEAVQASAQKRADTTGSSVLVYRSLLAETSKPVYGVAFTLPMWGERVGERIYPRDIKSYPWSGRSLADVVE
jgi:hypothetical protein